jgi:diguanylate cyclase (GGDEF)-like protein
MAKGIREKSLVVFVGMPDDFRRAHRSQLEAISFDAHWVERAGLIPHNAEPTALILNLDEKANTDQATWECLRVKFPQAELVALSSRDSAQLAMLCLREGFADFLTQPVSPDELVLCLLRCRQRHESIFKKPFPRGDITRTFTQISGCSSVATLRLRTSSALRALLGGTSVDWVSNKDMPGRRARGRVVLPFQTETHGCFVVEGVASRISRLKMNQASALVEHAELTLINLKRVDKLKRQTFIDDLTGLYNSRYLRFALESASIQALQRKEAFGLLFIDVDRFKSVNDECGHLVGSDFLTALGRIIKNAVRTGDSVFRYGGDEFVILLRNAGIERSTEVAERLRKQIENRGFVIRNVKIKSTVSIGLSVFPDHGRDLDHLIHLADEAMYAAKKFRNQVKVATAKQPRPLRIRRPEPTL